MTDSWERTFLPHLSSLKGPSWIELMHPCKWTVFSGLQFLVFELITGIYSVSFRIQSKYGKIKTRKISIFGKCAVSWYLIDKILCHDLVFHKISYTKFFRLVNRENKLKWIFHSGFNFQNIESYNYSQKTHSDNIYSKGKHVSSHKNFLSKTTISCFCATFREFSKKYLFTIVLLFHTNLFSSL